MNSFIIRTAFVSLSALFLGASSCSTPDLRGYQETLATNGFVTVFNPPHGGLNAGVVLYGTMNESQLNINHIVCRDGLFAGASITTDKIGVANFEATTQNDFNLAITILKKVLGDDLSAKIESKRKSTTKVIFTDPEENSLADESIYNNGGLRELKQNCYAALKDLKEKGEYEDHVFLLTNVMRAKVHYKFDLESTGSASASGTPLKEILSASAGAGWAISGKTDLTVDAPLYLAARTPRLMKDFVPKGLVAGGFAEVKLLKINVKSITMK